MAIREKRDLDILQVTINNKCNLACEHCYLNMAGTGYMESRIIEMIFSPENRPEKIAIVGMEPLYDKQSAALVRQIARRGNETDTFVSMITNGLGFKYLLKTPENEIPKLIDISLDGGPERYAHVRGNGKNLFPRILAGAEALRAAYPNLPVNILHTLFAENSTQEAVTDMMKGGRLVSPTGSIFFSPFVPPAIQIGQRVPTAHPQSIDQMLKALSENAAFMDDPAAFFFMGVYNADTFGLSMKELAERIDSYGLTNKSRIDKGVPHLNGGLRVMFDGCAIRPDYSIHTRLTQQYKRPIAGQRLADIYESFKPLPSVKEALAA